MNTKKVVYTKDKNVKITFRCDDCLSRWVEDRAKIIGLTPSAFVRQSLYQQFYAEKTLGEVFSKPLKAASAETAATCKPLN